MTPEFLKRVADANCEMVIDFKGMNLRVSYRIRLSTGTVIGDMLEVAVDPQGNINHMVIEKGIERAFERIEEHIKRQK